MSESKFRPQDTISAMLLFVSRGPFMLSKARRLKRTESQNVIEFIEYFVQIMFACLFNVDFINALHLK